jgi:hypothetical protein
MHSLETVCAYCVCEVFDLLLRCVLGVFSPDHFGGNPLVNPAKHCGTPNHLSYRQLSRATTAPPSHSKVEFVGETPTPT